MSPPVVENTLQIPFLSTDRFMKANPKKVGVLKTILTYIVNPEVLVISENDIIAEIRLTENKKKKKIAAITDNDDLIRNWNHNIKDIQTAKKEFGVHTGIFKEQVELFCIGLVNHFYDEIYDLDFEVDKSFILCKFPSLEDHDMEILENQFQEEDDLI